MISRPLFRGGHPCTARTVFLVTLEHFADRVAKLKHKEQEAEWDRLSLHLVGLPNTSDGEQRLLEARWLAAALPNDYGNDIDIEWEDSP